MDRYEIGGSEASDIPNKLGLKDPYSINEAEFAGFLAAQEAAVDALSPDTVFTLAYLYNLHRAALGEVYEFAGKLRTVNMSKDGFVFPSAAFLEQTMETFERAFLEPLNAGIILADERLLDHVAALHAELLYIHPFREGNGRTIRLFTRLISLAKRGHDLDFQSFAGSERFSRYVAAVQQAATGEYSLMQALFREADMPLG